MLITALSDRKDEGDETKEIFINCRIRREIFELKINIIIRNIEENDKDIFPFIIQNIKNKDKNFQVCYNVYGDFNSNLNLIKYGNSFQITAKIYRYHFINAIRIFNDGIYSTISTKGYKLMNDYRNWESSMENLWKWRIFSKLNILLSIFLMIQLYLNLN